VERRLAVIDGARGDFRGREIGVAQQLRGPGDRHAGHEHGAMPVARPQQAPRVDPYRV
jgi:hypothetical protein